MAGNHTSRKDKATGGGGGAKRAHHPPERSASFHGRTAMAGPPPAEIRQMRRPKTQPDLLAGGAGRRGGDVSPPPSSSELEGGERPNFVRVPAKVLVNVTVQRSLGAVQVMASTEWTVEELVAAAVRNYIKEGRRPPLPSTEPSAFGLHYSQFSLECLDPNEKLIGLGSRNFFLCPKSAAAAAVAASSSSSSCSEEAEKASKIAFPSWLRFMDFLL